ncbi:hypothetical protein F5Y04DRAFT_70714 [Hypomontagnella monticulosa]|nr:hypothetical protein F5Y04DRAFT_70714 [Hypomontagnella monticulosa]
MAPTGGPRSSAALNTNSSMSDWQVAASNSTLNTWVGGRQPSWLANAKPVKPTPRPSHPPPPPQPQPQVQPSKQHITADNHNHVETTDPLPIVATTQPASLPVSAPATTSAPPRCTHPAQPGPPQPPPIQTQASSSAAHAVLPSPAPSDEPSPGIAESLNAVSVTQARFVLDTPLDDCSEARPQSRVSAADARTSSRQGKGVAATARTTTPANMALNTPPTPNLPPANINIAPREQLENPPAKRRRVENISKNPPRNPLLQFFESCGASRRLEARIQEIGGWDNLGRPVEQPRYRLLSEACEKRDLVFIALHQLFCTWSVRRVNVHQLCTKGVHFPNVVDAAFGIMETILKSNSNMRQDHVEWFAEFPGPLNFLRTNPVYASILVQVLDFLMCLSGKWLLKYNEHQTHGYPFLMSEFVNDFHLFSPNLQIIMFRASRRSLGIPDGGVAQHMEELFKKDQQRHRTRDGIIIRLVPSPEYEKYNISLTKEYKTIVARNRPSQSHRQEVQQPNHGAQAIQQPGLYPPTMNPQIQPQLPGNGNRVPGFQPHLAPLPSNSATPSNDGRPSNLTRGPINTSPTFVNPIPAGFTLPSNHFPHNGSLPTVSSPSSPFLQPHSPNIQVQFSPPSSGAQIMSAHLLREQQLQQQQRYQQIYQHQMQIQEQYRRRLSQQGGSVTSVSPQSIPSPTGVYGQSYPMQPTAQPHGAQNDNGQPGRPTQLPNPGSHVSNNGILSPTSITNALLANRHQGPNHHSPQAVHQRPPKEIVDRLVPPHGVTLPYSNYPRSPYCEVSVKASLHQAHLRSPKRMPQEPVSVKPERYYQAVKSFALSPVVTPPQAYLRKFKFTISELDYSKITRDVVKPGGFYPVNLFSSGSLRVRIRCCYKKKKSTPFSDSTWITTDTTWPQHIFMDLNGQTLSIMRKAHHSKDQPVEASSFVISGENSLSVYIPEVPTANNQESSEPPEPHIAVEIVEVLSHSAVLQMVKTYGTMPATKTRDIIKRRLGGSSSGNASDDELEMVDSLSIDLADPFSSRIFNVPVRGKACTHLECFDLETWLNTRLGKKSCYCGRESACTKCPKEPSFVDKWKCPLCNKDARPYSLHIDGFLVEVRSRLESENKLGTKSILVSSDGTWKPKEEPGGDDSGNDSDDDGDVKPPVRPKPITSSSAPSQRERAPIEIIELD